MVGILIAREAESTKDATIAKICLVARPFEETSWANGTRNATFSPEKEMHWLDITFRRKFASG